MKDDNKKYFTHCYIYLYHENCCSYHGHEKKKILKFKHKHLIQRIFSLFIISIFKIRYVKVNVCRFKISN